jgi:hypothetical protein
VKHNDIWPRLLKEIPKFKETQAQQAEGEARSNVTMSTLQLANLLPYVAIKSFSRPIFPGPRKSSSKGSSLQLIPNHWSTPSPARETLGLKEHELEN